MAVQRRGTIFPSKDFDAAKAAQALWKAVDGIGKFSELICFVLQADICCAYNY